MLNALLITLAIYAIPSMFHGKFWFIQASVSSILYIILIYHFAKIRERGILIGVEFISMACIATSFYQFYVVHSSNFISDNIAAILNAVFFLEIFIVMLGGAIGVRKRDPILRRACADHDKSCYRNLLRTEGFI